MTINVLPFIFKINLFLINYMFKFFIQYIEDFYSKILKSIE